MGRKRNKPAIRTADVRRSVVPLKLLSSFTGLRGFNINNSNSGQQTERKPNLNGANC